MIDGSNQPEAQSTERLISLGVRGTKIYFILILATLPTFALLGWIELSALELNQVGDFLAGLFGPLAIFWIVLGFFQQGEELRNSVRTLQLQTKELQESVEQQKVIASAAKEQIEIDRDAREREMIIQTGADLPFFEPDTIVFSNGASLEGANYAADLVNTGGFAREVTVSLLNDRGTIFHGAELTFFGEQDVVNGGKIQFYLRVPTEKDDLDWQYNLRVVSVSSLERVRIQDFTIRKGVQPIPSLCRPPGKYLKQS